MRVSDADRDSIAAQLREHYAQGRLSLDELNQRLEHTFAARTRTDLNAVTGDLPYAAPSGLLPGDQARHGGQGRNSPAAYLSFIPLMVCLGVCFAVLGLFGFGFGGPWVIVVAVLGALRWIFGRGRGRGPARRPCRPPRRGRRPW
ncbi:MAG TPA: DUF1707 domain-containing protein [Streptosporangiaceae bacterium]